MTQEEYNKILLKYRAEFLKLYKGLEGEYDKIADEMLKKTNAIIDKYKLKNDTISAKSLETIKKEIDETVDWFQKVNTRWIDNNITKGAEMAIIAQDTAARYFVHVTLTEQGASAAVVQKLLDDPKSPLFLQTAYGEGLPKAVRDQVWKKRWADGKKLSDRIWNSTKIGRTNLHHMIEQCVNEGMSAVDFSKEVEKYLKETGPKWTTAIRPAKTERGTLKYNSLRLSRTETNNSYRKAMEIGAGYSVITEGLKWNLSRSHPKFDICNVWASQNLYELGPGGYPAGLLPQGHPNCLCYTTHILKQSEDLINAIKQKYNMT